MLDPAASVLHEQAEVLRGELVGQLQSFLQAVRHYSAAICKSCLSHFRALELLQLTFDLLLDGFGKGQRRRQQDRPGQCVVLGLGQKVGGAESGVGGIVGDDDGLGWAIHGVDADRSEELLLGKSYEQITWAAYLVDPGDRLGAEGQGRDGLGATCAKYGVDTCDTGGGELQGRDAAIGTGGSCDVDFVNACHLRRNDGH